MEILKQEEPKEIEISVPEIKEPINNELDGTETKAEEISESNLEVWESENNRKFGHNYFKIREIAHEFNIKMDFGNIDKYVKNEIKNRSWENSTESYKKILQEIETEIGSTNLDVFSRLKKLSSYINAIKKLYEAKKLKEKYLIGEIPS